MNTYIPISKRDMSQCPIRHVLSRLCDKWSILIMLIVDENGTVRYNDIARQIPDISSRVLSSKLKTLVEMRLLSRRLYPEVPPKVEYSLTEQGNSFIPVLGQLIDWAMGHVAQNESRVKK